MTVKKSTRKLIELLHPDSLEDTLKELKARGDVDMYKIGARNTTIKISATADLASLFQEATALRSDGRPEVWKKRNFKS